MKNFKLFLCLILLNKNVSCPVLVKDIYPKEIKTDDMKPGLPG